MEHKNKKCPEQHIIGDSSIQYIKKGIQSEVNTTLKAEVPELVASTLEERLSSKVEAIIDRRFEKLMIDIKAGNQENEEVMNQTVKTLTSDFESSNIEELRSDMNASNQENKQMMSQSLESLMSQLTSSNTEVTKCVSNLSTIVEHLSSKVSAIEGHLDSNQETSSRMRIDRQRRCEELCDTIARNQKEQMINRSLQQALTSEDHSTISNTSDNANDTLNVERMNKRGVECFEEDSLNVLKTIQEELHQSLTFCQTMLS